MEAVSVPSGGRQKGFDLTSYQWSPRGDTILLAGVGDLWLLDPANRQSGRLTHDGVEKEVPTFSPAGERIAFVKKHDLYLVDVKSGAVRRLTRDGSDTDLQWPPRLGVWGGTGRALHRARL